MPLSPRTWLDLEHRWLRFGAVLLVMALVVKSAWVCDDSFITMRTVDNLLHGLGLTWNPGERVQSFTHPLWFLVLVVADLLAPGGYSAILGASLVTSGAFIALALLRPGMRPVGIVVLALAFSLSRAFVDFATSGLENPLACLLLVLAIRITHPARGQETARHGAVADGAGALPRLTLLAALLALTRLDLVLLMAPVLAWPVLAGGWRHWRPLLLAMTPLLAWELFAIVYFGFPLPNTAYAKLATGVPAADLMSQGWAYLQATLQRDPVTALLLIVGLGGLLWRGDRNARLWAAGVGLYLVYIVRIGGDFMMGRFLVAPFVTVVVLAVQVLPVRRATWALPALLLAGLLNPRNPVTAPVVPVYEYWFRGIADERGYYYAGTGLLARFRPGFTEHEFVVKGRLARELMLTKGDAFHTVACIGFYGYYAGPRMHLIDVMALSDPFLARLPARDAHDPRAWRIGHFERDLPAGYSETIAADRNLIKDPALARLYDDLRLVTRGPLFSGERWRAIWRLNSGWPAGR